MMNKVHVIVNPLSARGKTEQRWHSIKEVIRHHFKEYKYVFTEKPRQATEIAKELLEDGFDLIIGVGGDGTLNEITNGFFCHDTHKAINEDASIGIIPSGTGSDFIRFLKIPRDLKKSVELIKNSPSSKIDVGKITFLNEKPSQSTRYFMNVADFGLGAEVIQNLSAVPSAERNAFFYYKGLLSTVKSYKSKKVKIIIDDSQEIVGEFLIGAIANGRMFGGGMVIAPQASPFDGYFDLVLIEDMTRLHVVANSIRLYRGTIEKNPRVSILRAKNIKVYSQDDVRIECDGELGSGLPAEFSIIEKCLNFRI